MHPDDEGQAIENLIGTLKNRNWPTREKAIEALVNIGEPAVLPLLEALARKAENHLHIVRALGRIGDPRAVEPLINELDTQNFFLTQEAAVALGKIGDPRAVYPLINVFRLGWNDREAITTWQQAAWALAAIGESALSPLLDALNDELENVRSWSAEALEQLSDPRTVDSLIKALQDEKRSVRAGAVDALSKIGDERAIESVSILLKDEDWYLRCRAAFALGEIGGSSVFDPLVGALTDVEPQVRRAVVSALGKIQHERSLDLLVVALKDPDAGVRSSAVFSLGQIGDERMLPLLEWVQQNDSVYFGANRVKDTATYAIQQIQARSQKS